MKSKLNRQHKIVGKPNNPHVIKSSCNNNWHCLYLEQSESIDYETRADNPMHRNANEPRT